MKFFLLEFLKLMSCKNRNGVMLANIFFIIFSQFFKIRVECPFNSSQRHHVLQSYFISQHLNAVSTSKWVIISTPSDACEAEPPSREHFSVSKTIDYIISVKRSRHNARNFDP